MRLRLRMDTPAGRFDPGPSGYPEHEITVTSNTVRLTVKPKTDERAME